MFGAQRNCRQLSILEEKSDEQLGFMVRSGHILKNSTWHAKEFGFYPEGERKLVRNSNEEYDKDQVEVYSGSLRYIRQLKESDSHAYLDQHRDCGHTEVELEPRDIEEVELARCVQGLTPGFSIQDQYFNKVSQVMPQFNQMWDPAVQTASQAVGVSKKRREDGS